MSLTIFSSSILNNKVDIGSPCHNPFIILNSLDYLPSIWTTFYCIFQTSYIVLNIPFLPTVSYATFKAYKIYVSRYFIAKCIKFLNSL